MNTRISDSSALASSLRQIADAQYTRRQRFNGRLPADVQEVIRMAADHLAADAVPVNVLDQILLDPENQPSQFGTVPVGLLEHCEEMISDLVHQFGDRGCTCTFPEDDCCAYARAEHYSHHPQPAALNEVSGNSGELGVDERARFEAWAIARNHDMHRAVDSTFFKDGDYTGDMTAEAWEAWRAALAATGKQQVGEVQS